MISKLPERSVSSISKSAWHCLTCVSSSDNALSSSSHSYDWYCMCACMLAASFAPTPNYISCERHTHTHKHTLNTIHNTNTTGGFDLTHSQEDRAFRRR